MSKTQTRKGQVRRYILDIALSVDQLERFYAGRVNQVSAIDIYGRRIQFPLNTLRPYVGHMGVKGRFQLEVTADARLLSVKRV